IEPVGGDAQADTGTLAQRDRRRTAKPRRIERGVDAGKIEPVAGEGEAARQRSLAQPIRWHAVARRAEPGENAAEVIGIRREDPLPARPPAPPPGAASDVPTRPPRHPRPGTS